MSVKFLSVKLLPARFMPSLMPSSMLSWVRALILPVAALLVAHGATAGEQPRADYRVYLDNGPGGQIRIADLITRGSEPNIDYEMTLNAEVFGDYFLSMRPFRCLSYEGRMFCYLPYPYENRHSISATSLTDLEYDLLFIARTPTEYGIDPWNGRYFRLRWEGENIVGEIHETDLNVLAAPPEDGSLRPLANAEIVPIAATAKQWTPKLLIKPR